MSRPARLVFMGNAGVRDVQQYDVYSRRGGYASLKKALAMKPPELVDLVEKAQIRGRGGAGFNMGRKWKFVPPKSKVPKPTYLAVNADEGEPGTFKDRWLLENDPHRLVEGIAIAAWALGVHDAYVYVRGEFLGPAGILKKAIGEAYDAGLLGRRLLDKPFRLDVTVHMGAGAYVCGEETGLLNSIEGRPGQPSVKPPFPAVSGLWKSPTIVNNVESLSALPALLDMGVDRFLALGAEGNGGTKLFSISGHVRRPGVYEARHDVTLRELIESHDYCQGVREGHTLKAVIPGGSSSPVLLPDEIDLPMTFDALMAAGSMLGSGATMVLDETTDVVAVTARLAHFYHHESCGQCTPCRVGTGWLHRILESVKAGTGRVEDLDLVLSVGKQMQFGRTICALADGAVLPLIALVTKFRSEFEEYIARGGPATATTGADEWS